MDDIGQNKGKPVEKEYPEKGEFCQKDRRDLNKYTHTQKNPKILLALFMLLNHYQTLFNQFIYISHLRIPQTNETSQNHITGSFTEILNTFFF